MKKLTVFPKGIKDVHSWPPGSAMAFNNHEFADNDRRHFAVGLVIFNDGDGTIMVMWPGHCKEHMKTYDVKSLNEQVIRKVW